MPRYLYPAHRWLAFFGLVSFALAAPARAQDEGLFDRLFGTDPAGERAGAAADGLALPSLFADGKLITEAIPLHDLGADGGACVAIVPLLGALELAYTQAGAGKDFVLTLPEPQREAVLPAAALLPSPSGDCLPLADVGDYLPLALSHDAVGQRLLLDSRAPLPVLMRLARADRQARLHPETSRPAFPLLARPKAGARLWSADLAAGLVTAQQGQQMTANLLVSGEMFGLAGRLSLAMTSEGRIVPGLTLSDARDNPDLLGPLGARSVALGDVAAPGQPLIADALSGRGLVLSSRAPWQVDLVDTIVLSGPMPVGWEAELWHEERLVAVTRTPDAAGRWQFGNIPVRIGENRWIVRLFGPNGETSEEVFYRLVGTEMNAENEINYTIGVIDGGRPLLGKAADTPAGPTAFARLNWGVTSDVTARFDLRTGTSARPALALGADGALAGTLWSVTGVRDRLGGLGGAVRVARRIGGQDIVFDLARHGRDDGPGVPPQVREFERVMSVTGQGRIGLGRLSVPWQMRLQSGELRRGGVRHVAAARMVVPMMDWQANLALGAVREGSAAWRGTAALGLTARRGDWRLRSGVTASDRDGWRIDVANVSAMRNLAGGALSVDLDWQADSGKLAGGASYGRQLGALGLSAGIGREAEGWRFGVGLTLGLWRSGGRWRSAPAGIARSGTILAEMFVDEDGDGARGPNEAGVADGRFVVGAALRRETTDTAGRVLIGGIAPGPQVDIETQLSSLDDFTLRPVRAGDRLTLRPGEVRHVPVPLRPTGSIEVRVLLVAGDRQTPRSDVPVILRDAEGREVARAITDFEGYALFDALPFGTFQAEAIGRSSGDIALSREQSDDTVCIRVPPAP